MDAFGGASLRQSLRWWVGLALKGVQKRTGLCRSRAEHGRRSATRAWRRRRRRRRRPDEDDDATSKGGDASLSLSLSLNLSSSTNSKDIHTGLVVVRAMASSPYPPQLTSPPLPLVAVVATPSLLGADQALAQHLSASRPPLVAVPAAAHESLPAAGGSPAEALARLFGEAFDSRYASASRRGASSGRTNAPCPRFLSPPLRPPKPKTKTQTPP